MIHPTQERWARLHRRRRLRPKYFQDEITRYYEEISGLRHLPDGRWVKPAGKA